jgi:hypothetical protein
MGTPTYKNYFEQTISCPLVISCTGHNYLDGFVARALLLRVFAPYPSSIIVRCQWLLANAFWSDLRYRRDLVNLCSHGVKGVSIALRIDRRVRRHHGPVVHAVCVLQESFPAATKASRQLFPQAGYRIDSKMCIAYDADTSGVDMIVADQCSSVSHTSADTARTCMWSEKIGPRSGQGQRKTSDSFCQTFCSNI